MAAPRACWPRRSARSGATLHAQRAFGGYAVGRGDFGHPPPSARSGLVTGVATPLHLGGSVATYEIVITDEDGRPGVHRAADLRAAPAVRPDVRVAVPITLRNVRG